MISELKYNNNINTIHTMLLASSQTLAHIMLLASSQCIIPGHPQVTVQYIKMGVAWRRGYDTNMRTGSSDFE